MSVSSGNRHIGIVLFDAVEELDATGPWEVLAHWTENYPEDGWTVSCLSADGRPVTASKGLVLGAHHSFEQAPAMGVLLHPGGRGARSLLRSPSHLRWMRQQSETVPLMTSVCTGALVLAAAGLLRGRSATTFRPALGELEALDPTINVVTDQRWVDDGEVITSAGVSAGIDMALYLVARLAGESRGRQVKDGIQYDPAPPF